MSKSCIHLLSFGLDPRGDLVGFPPSLGNGLGESEGGEGANVKTRALTVRKPSQDLSNKSMEPSLGTLVLINDIKVNGHKTASGASQHSCNRLVSLPYCRL